MQSLMNKKIKVIEFISELRMGGAETLVKDYVLNIDKEKFDVSIIVTSAELHEEYEKIIRKSGVKIYFIGNHLKLGKLNFLQRIKRRLDIVRYTIKLVSELDPDVIHIHLNLLKYMLPVAMKFRDIRFVYTLHSPVISLFYEKDEIFSAKILLKMKRLRMIALQKNMREEMQEYFHVKDVIVLENGIDISKYRDIRVEKLKSRKELNIKQDAFLVGHIGRFVEQKNHKFLINVFEIVHKIRPDSHLLLVGNGKLMPEIKKQIEDYGLTDVVTILSNRIDVNELLKLMDIFVLPSKYEGLGIVAVEAQASGVPCVVSDGVNDEVCLSDRFIKMDYGADPEKWADVILNFPEHSNRKINDINNYDIRNVMHKLEEIYAGEV